METKGEKEKMKKSTTTTTTEEEEKKINHFLTIKLKMRESNLPYDEKKLEEATNTLSELITVRDRKIKEIKELYSQKIKNAQKDKRKYQKWVKETQEEIETLKTLLSFPLSED